MESASRTETAPGGERKAYAVVIALFFVSGLTSLIYQVIWTRLLVFVFGSTTFATATVLAVFMGGLALGSFAAGRLADRIRRPFRLYGLLEGAIGLWALLIPLLFDAAIPMYRLAWQAFHLQVLPFSLMRFVVAAFVLLLPTTCMGATLPLLARFVTRSLSAIGNRVGTLYAVNTFGAVAGALAGGFLLLPATGIATTTLIAAAGNILLCLVAVLCAQRFEAAQPPPDTGAALAPPEAPVQQAPDAPAQADNARTLVTATIVAFAAAGAVSMIYEVAWTRSLLLVVGSTTYAFTTMLSTFLVGIFLGSLVMAKIVDRLKNPLAWFAALELAVCLSGLVSIALFNYVPYWNLVAGTGGLTNPAASQAIRFLICALVLLPITIFTGATFPAVVKACTTDLQAVGQSVGSLYSANTLGAIVGAFAAGFVIVPALGAERSLVAGSLANLVIGTWLLCLLPGIRRRLKYVLAAACLVIVGGKVAQGDTWDHLLLISAQVERRFILYIPSMASYLSSFGDWASTLHQTSELIFYKDGPCANVGVLRFKSNGSRSLLTNGHIDASDGDDMPNQLLLALYPVLFCEHPERIAVVGWGSGVTVGAAALSPAASITGIEIEPSVLPAAQLFSHVNHRPEDDPRVHVEVNDGRNYLLATPESFDIIISEPSNPWQAGVCNLFTKEFFAICANRLAPGGVFSLWVQIGEVSPENIKRILAALRTSFRYTLPLQSTGGDMIVLASQEPLRINYERCRRILADPRYQAAFKRSGIPDADVLLSHILVSSPAVDKFTQGITPNSDDRNRLEYEIARTYENKYYTLDNALFFATHSGNLLDNVDWGPLSAAERAVIASRVAGVCLANWKPVSCLTWAKLSLAQMPAPEAWRLAALAQIDQGDKPGGMASFAEALRLDPAHSSTLITRGMEFRKDGDVLSAREDFHKVLALAPDNKLALLRLAQTYMSSVRGALAHPPKEPVADEPVVAMRYLCRLAGDREFIAHNHEVLRLEAMAELAQGNSARAESLLKEFLRLEPLNLAAWHDLGKICARRGEATEARRCEARANKLSEDLVKILVANARAAAHQRRDTESANLLAQCLLFAPHNPDALTLLRELSTHNQRAAQVLEQRNGQPGSTR